MSGYLVTGIAGFIGSALAHSLLERGERVRGIDNFSTGKSANVAGIRSRIELIEADLNDILAESGVNSLTMKKTDTVRMNPAASGGRNASVTRRVGGDQKGSEAFRACRRTSR